MSPGAACGDPRAAPGYMEARRHAPRGAPGAGVISRRGPPRPPTTYRLVAVGFRALGVAGVVFGAQQACPRGVRGAGY